MQYSKNHVWVESVGNRVRVGLSDFAQQELGELTFIELPEIDTSVAKSSVLCSLDSLKAASDIYSPVSGMVRSINRALMGNASLVNSDPLGEGWICEIEIDNPSELDELLSKEDYFTYIAE